MARKTDVIYVWMNPNKDRFSYIIFYIPRYSESPLITVLLNLESGLKTEYTLKYILYDV